MTRTLFLAAGLLALAAPAVAQTGYGQPSPGQYRTEQRTTADLNRQANDDRDDAAWDDRGAPPFRAGDPRSGYDDDRGRPPGDARYARDRVAYERDRADYRRRSAEHRADLARWRERVAACNAGVRDACAGYEERFGSYAGGRYAPPPFPERDPRYGSAAPYSDPRYGNLPGRTDDWRDAPGDRDDAYGDGGYDDDAGADDDGDVTGGRPFSR